MSKRDDARAAMVASGIAALALLFILLDDVFHLNALSSPGELAYASVTALIALGAVGPWLSWTRRGARASISTAPGRVVVDGDALEAEDVAEVGVALGARGQSVLVKKTDERVVFFEVEREGDAARIVAALGEEKKHDSATIHVKRPRRLTLLGAWQAMLSWACLVCAPLYWLSATDHVATSNGKATAGITGVVATLAAFALLAVRGSLKSQALAVRRGAYDAHLDLHRDAPIATKAGIETDRAAPEEGARKTLARGEEPVREWLARIDALPNEAHAYRGDAMKKDVLWETLSDDGAPVDARMGAARLLAKRHGEEGGALVRVVSDPDVRVRVEAALEEEEEIAEERLERLGPLFRAR